ncbi:MAG: hypothetical protein H7X93_02385 [Sphingomonadaceae bacterium]|nr:hypothetical protein [Sphingomonadaceae bacterium]
MKGLVFKSAVVTTAALLLAGTALAQNARPLAPGQSRNGTLSTRSPMMTENIYYLDRYTISGSAGDRVAITMRSESFDTYLEVGRMEGESFSVLGSDDDSGGELDSRLVFTFPETDSYIVRARTFGANTTGAYTIAVETVAPPGPPPPPTPIQVGQTVEGSFTADSPSYMPNGYEDYGGGTGRHYALYTLTGAAGQTVTVTLRSTEFDAYLEIGADTPLGFGVVQSNDDMPMPAEGEVTPAVDPEMMAHDEHGEMEHSDFIGTLDSQIRFTFQSAGTVMIRATTLASDTTGAYTLSVE